MSTKREKCPYCKQFIDNEATVCPWCHSDTQGVISALLFFTPVSAEAAGARVFGTKAIDGAAHVVARDGVQAAQGSTSAITKFYPANNGFVGAVQRTFLMPGEQISRYGSTAGKFFSPANTSLPMRALPPNANTNMLNLYTILKPFEVQAGTIAPAFGQPGLGIQYVSPVSAETLLKWGIIGY